MTQNHGGKGMSAKDWWQRAKKPYGGFIFMTVTQICMVWWSYRERHITLKDLRVYFALREMVARRCEKDPDVPETYTPREANNLISGGGAKASIAKLHALGLTDFSENRISFATSPSQLRIDDLDGLTDMIAKVRNNARRVPVPRQIGRLICSCWKPTVIATALGHLFTGFYYKQGQCVSGGSCKASDIADIFSLDIRSIKAARKFLTEGLKQKASGLSWLILHDTPQWKLNKDGQGFLINLDWKRQDLEAGRATAETAPPVDNSTVAEDKRPPPAAQNDAKSPPPYILTQNPIQEVNNKTPLERGRSKTDTTAAPPTNTKPGFAGNQQPAAGGTVGNKSVEKQKKAPSLTWLQAADFSDYDRRRTLHQQAVEQGLAEDSQEGLLKFCALMSLAQLRGVSNPSGYFLQLLKRQAWEAVTAGDLQAERQRLGIKPTPKKPLLGGDAAMVVTVSRKLQLAPEHAEVFAEIQRRYRHWCKEQHEDALEELQAYREKLHAWKAAQGEMKEAA